MGSAAVAVATAEPIHVEQVAFEQVAPVATETLEATPAKAKKGSSRMLSDMLISLVVVGAIVVTIASTLVAMRAMKQRDAFKDEAQQGATAIDAIVTAAANSSRLKGPANAQARQEIFAPAIAYYQKIAYDLHHDPENLDRAVAARQRSAALNAKSGKSALVGDLKNVAELLDAMRAADYDPTRYPSLNKNALQITSPMEWVMVKDLSMQIHAMGLLQSFELNMGELRNLAHKHPQTPTFRDDLAAMLGVSGTLQMALPERHPFAMNAWSEARDILEGLVREQPGNVDYQVRLVEALTALANLQKQHDEKDNAIANLKRAVEVREQMAQANPEDKALASELAKAKNDLAKLETAG